MPNESRDTPANANPYTVTVTFKLSPDHVIVNFSLFVQKSRKAIPIVLIPG